jgi:hypothetical protein
VPFVNGVPGCIVLGLPVDLGVLGKIAFRAPFTTPDQDSSN